MFFTFYYIPLQEAFEVLLWILFFFLPGGQLICGQGRCPVVAR